MRRLAAVPPAGWAVFAAVIVVGLVGARWMAPWATRDVGVRAGTPVPPARVAVTPIAVRPGRQACVVNATIPSDAGVAVMSGTTRGGARGPRMAVTAFGPGYRFQGVVAAGWSQVVRIVMTPPRHDLVGSICVRNAGRVTALLNGNGEPGATGRATSTVAGRPAAAPIALELQRARLSSRLSRTGEMLDRAVSFSWGPLSGWLARLVALLIVIGVPVGVVAALSWAMEADRRGLGSGGAE